MMLSPETYYEKLLKGKTKEQIMTAIWGLKQEIGLLKNAMEGLENGITETVYPSEDTRINCTREYLEKAKQAYVKAGGVYTLSKAEEKTADFDANMDEICRITFSIGGYPYGYRTYVVDLTDGLKAYTKLWEDEEPLSLWDDDNEDSFTKDTFINALKDLHIGEWRGRYSTARFGYSICDGTQWKLKIEYRNGHRPTRFDGDNSYPYNFDKFKKLFGIDDSRGDEDE